MYTPTDTDVMPIAHMQYDEYTHPHTHKGRENDISRSLPNQIYLKNHVCEMERKYKLNSSVN